MKALLIFLSIMLLPIQKSIATTIIYSNMEKMMEMSDTIIKGDVLDIMTKYHDDNLIYTTIIISNAYQLVEGELLALNHLVKVRHQGGVIEEFDENGNMIKSSGMVIAGTPAFEVGEEVLLYLTGNGFESIPFTGFNQGVFKVDKDNNVVDQHDRSIVGFEGNDIIKRDEDTVYIGERPARKNKTRHYLKSKKVKKEEFLSILKEQHKNKSKKSNIAKKSRKSSLHVLPLIYSVPELLDVQISSPIAVKPVNVVEEN